MIWPLKSKIALLIIGILSSLSLTQCKTGITLSSSNRTPNNNGASNSAPTISNVTNKSTNEDTASAAIAFTIADVDNSLVCTSDVVGTSSDTTLVPNANIVIAGAGTSCTVTITPAANQNGTSTITLTVSDGLASANDTFVLTVNAVNDAPTITNVANQSTNENTATGAIAFTIADIDSAVTCTGSVTGGSSDTTLVPNANVVVAGAAQSCTVTITPAAGETGTSTITLTVSDGALTANDTFVLTVNAVNDAPTISNVANQSTNEDTATGAIAFTIADTDSAITCTGNVTGGSSNTTLVPNANIVIAGAAQSCTVTITPAANQNGTSTITLTVTDGTSTANDTFVLTVNAVNDAPTITDTSNQSTAEDTATGAVAFTIADIDSAVTCTGSVTGGSSNTTLIPNANIVIAGAAQSCTVTITPAANETGTSTITLTVSDGALSNNDTFVLTVSTANDAPTISDVANQSTNEDTATGAIAFTIADIDSAITCTGNVTGGSSNTTLVPNANIVIAGAAQSCTVTITPAANQNGTATITLTVTDGTSSANDTFVLTVNSVNDAPTITDVANQSTNEDTATGAIAFTIADVDSAVTCTGSVTGGSSDTTLVPNANVVIAGAAQSCTVTITPAANLTGTSTITLTVSDGALSANDTFVLTVNAVDDAPTITNVTDQSTNEDTATGAIAFTIADIDSAITCTGDVTGDSSNTTLVPNANIVIAGAAQSCTVTITPAANQTGTSTITLTVSDGTSSANDTFVLTVNGVNDAPTISDVSNQSTNEDTATGAIAFTIADVDSAVTCTGNVTGGSSDTTVVPNANIVIAGAAQSCTVTITPAANQNGSSTITLTVSDGTASNNDTFVLTVNAVNDAPTISNVADQSTNEDTATGAIAFTIADIDSAITCTGSVTGGSSDTTLVPNANIVVAGAAQSCTVTITPAANQTGTSTITLTVTDGALTANDTFVLTVNTANDAPTISDTTNKSTNEDTASAAIAFTIADVDSAITCTGSVTGTSSDTTLVPNANIVIAGAAQSCTVTITPAANLSGTTTITLTVSDGSLTANDTFVLTVNAVDDAPTTSDGTLTVYQVIAQNGSSSGTLSGTDPEGDAKTFSIVSQGSKGTAAILNAATGAFSYTPIAYKTGVDTFTFRVAANAVNSNTSTITVTIVEPVSDPLRPYYVLDTTTQITLNWTDPGTGTDGYKIKYATSAGNAAMPAFPADCTTPNQTLGDVTTTTITTTAFTNYAIRICGTSSNSSETSTGFTIQATSLPTCDVTVPNNTSMTNLLTFKTTYLDTATDANADGTKAICLGTGFSLVQDGSTGAAATVGNSFFIYAPSASPASFSSARNIGVYSWDAIFFADGTGIRFANLNLTTSGSSGSGIFQNSGSIPLVSGVTVSTTGASAPGIYFTGSATNVNKVDVSTTGSGAGAIAIGPGGSMAHLNRATLSTTNTSAYGIHNLGTFSKLSGSSVSTAGTTAIGIYSGGTFSEISDTTVTTSGGGGDPTDGASYAAWGIYYEYSAGFPLINKVTVTTTGDYASALACWGSGVAGSTGFSSVTNSTLQTKGLEAHGFYSWGGSCSLEGLTNVTFIRSAAATQDASAITFDAGNGNGNEIVDTSDVSYVTICSETGAHKWEDHSAGVGHGFLRDLNSYASHATPASHLADTGGGFRTTTFPFTSAGAGIVSGSLGLQGVGTRIVLGGSCP